jgi:hypothetical protein
VSNTSIDLLFGDGSYTFALPLPQINELQRKCDIGIGGLFGRVTKGCFVDPGSGDVFIDAKAGEFYALDIIETIRHGLIGGGKGIVNEEEVLVTPQIANRLVDTYVLGNPIKPNWERSVSILGACILGYDPPKKDEPAPERATETTDTSTTA